MVVIEATVSLAVFMFAMLTVLLITDICVVQARIGGALASAAKSISKYSYLYYKLKTDGERSGLDVEGGGQGLSAQRMTEGVGSLADSMSAAGTGTSDSDVQAAGGAQDPGAAVTAMAQLAGSELGEEGKNLLGRALARAFVERDLLASPNDGADSFLRRYRVAGGLGGLDFSGTSLMENGRREDVRLVVSYDVTVIRLLNIDVKLRFTQRASTLAWGTGVPFAGGPSGAGGRDGMQASIWDSDNFTRGRYITDREKANFAYTGSAGFDGYDCSGGKNEFIQVVSMYGASYSSAGGVVDKLGQTLRNMRGIVSQYGGTVPMKDASGEEVAVLSSPSTRTYKILLVVPENADTAMIGLAAAAFEAERRAAGEYVSVEVKAAYGVPSGDGD
jgi:hypothetical protein